MSTLLQQDLAEAIVINRKLPRDKRKNKKELLVSVGYATKTATQVPTRTLEQKGVKDALREWGLTEELITTALVFDIVNKPKSRVKELGLGAEILNMKKEKDISLNFNILNISVEEKEIINKALDNI